MSAMAIFHQQCQVALQFQRARPHRVRLSCRLLLILVVSLSVGCDRADYTVLADVAAPDQSASALLVQRRGADSLSSDVYYVTISEKVPNASNISALARHNPVLVATHAEQLRLNWRTATELVVSCQACGLTKIDIIEKHEQSNRITVLFNGFPSGR
jgi:hypothetical protein